MADFESALASSTATARRVRAAESDIAAAEAAASVMEQHRQQLQQHAQQQQQQAGLAGSEGVNGGTADSAVGPQSLQKQGSLQQRLSEGGVATGDAAAAAAAPPPAFLAKLQRLETERRAMAEEAAEMSVQLAAAQAAAAKATALAQALAQVSPPKKC